MEYRKLIQFGGNSFVVSIPKKWITKNNLQKGDPIYVSFDKQNLILSPGNLKTQEKKVEVIIEVDNKTEMDTVRRRIFSSYVKGANNIIITGKNIGQYSENINTWLKHYIALELIEQTSNKIILKSYVDNNEVNIVSFVKRIDNTIKSMMLDLYDCVNKTITEKKEILRTVLEREENVDKIRRLLYRVIQGKLLHPELSKEKNPIELLRFWEIVKLLEKISNEIESIAFIIKENLKNKVKVKCDCTDKMLEVKKLLDKVMIAFYKYDTNMSNKIAYEIQDMLKDIRINCAKCNLSRKQIILNILCFMKDLNRLSI